jgi:hypothetical protein
MNSLNSFHSKVTTEHQAKLAYVYLRQSSPGQMLHNTESTVRQYALVDRAVALGWPKDRVQVIDEDLGRSGASADWRSACDGGQPGPRRVGALVGSQSSRA